jgi:hypothetical protein
MITVIDGECGVQCRERSKRIIKDRGGHRLGLGQRFKGFEHYPQDRDCEAAKVLVVFGHCGGSFRLTLQR